MVLFWSPEYVLPPVVTENCSQVPPLAASAGLGADTIKMKTNSASVTPATPSQRKCGLRFLVEPITAVYSPFWAQADKQPPFGALPPPLLRTGVDNGLS